jgi:hypothetical protein
MAYLTSGHHGQFCGASGTWSWMEKPKTEGELACELIRVLDGCSIQLARNALEHAVTLLSTTQIVRADSPLFVSKTETDRALANH